MGVSLGSITGLVSLLARYWSGREPSPSLLSSLKSFGFRRLEEITDGSDLLKATKSVARFSHFVVQVVIEQRLGRGGHIGLRYDYRSRTPQPPQIVPKTVLGTICLELDHKLRSAAP